MQPLLTPQQMQLADQFAIASVGIPDSVLMEHAALAALERLEKRFGALLPRTHGLVVAGPGNNGGDALALTRLLVLRGCPPPLVVAIKSGTPSPLFEIQSKALGQLGVRVQTRLDSSMVASAEWIVDGIFGTGLSRNPEGEFLQAIDLINKNSQGWVLSLDIPSGLSGSTGRPLGTAVKASETVSLGFYKKGLVTGLAADYVGTLTLAPIQIPRRIPGLEVESFLFEASDAAAFLPKRRPAGHKGDYGHVYVWAGTPDKDGAALMSSLAALRAGSGLTTLLGSEAQLLQIKTRTPLEIMTRTADSHFFSLEKPQVAVLGPGLGTTSEQWGILSAALGSPWKLVLDGDALTLIAEHRDEARKLLQKRSSGTTVITPHPKEAARLLNLTVEAIEQDRYQSAASLSSEFHCTSVLKGKGTIVHLGSEPSWVVTSGTTALSKGGSGDLLAGVTASLMGQGLESRTAASLGSYALGRASELLAKERGEERSLLASEIALKLSEVWKELECLKK